MQFDTAAKMGHCSDNYRVTKVVRDTVFVDFSMSIAPLALAGGDFIY